MLRIALSGASRSAFRCQQVIKKMLNPVAVVTASPQRMLSLAMTKPLAASAPISRPTPFLLSTNPSILALVPSPTNMQTARTVTKFSLKKGKRKTVKPVLKRFMRLDWGGWIRTRQGRNKKMWQKTGNLKRRLRQHVMVNATQAWLLDKMVTPFWRRPRHYVDDPYRPYHSRDEYFATRNSPIKY